MNANPSSGPEAAFRDLRRALARRRLGRANARLRAVVLALALVVGAFTYWQVRVPLDGVRRNRGEGAAGLALAGVLAVFVAAAAGTAASRQGAMLGDRPGPEWLALPAPPARVTAHLAEEARLPALAVVPPAAAALVAGAGLLPSAWLVALAVGFALAWRFATGAAAALARRMIGPPPASERALPPETRWLIAGPRRRAAARGPAPAWRRGPAVRALFRLDALSTRRATPARARFALAGAFALAGLLAWSSGADPMLLRAQAYAMFLPVAAALGAWAIRRACDAPADLHRPLPVRLRDAWLARAAPVAAALAALAALNALAAVALPGPARIGLVPAWSVTAVAVAVLGLHHGLTLVPRGDSAETVYFAWLGAALTASWMIPLLGWVVLLAGLVHASLRLPRWRTPEWAP